MGKLDVHISHGSSGPDPKVLLLVGAVILVACGGGGVAAAATAALATLVMWVAITFGVVLVAVVALCIVFRDRIRANLRPTQVVWRGNPHASPEPVRPGTPKQELHLHFHGDSEVDKAMLALRVASLRPESRMIGPGTHFEHEPYVVDAEVVRKRS